MIPLTKFSCAGREVSEATRMALFATHHTPISHNVAFREPREAFESGLVALVTGLAQYADSHREAYGSPLANDGVIGESWREAVSGVRGLLNGERGRLDGGALDGALLAMFAAAGFEGEP